MRQLNWAWRLLATGFSFSIFGIGGLLLSCIATPVLLILPSGAERRSQRAKALIHYACRIFIEMMCVLGVMTYAVEQRERLIHGGQLVLANHPSLLDVVILIAFIRNADCVVKQSLLNNPFTRAPIKMTGYIANSDPEQVIRLAEASIKRGNRLIIFPESTRTSPDSPITMRRGAANIALRAQCGVTPAVITCEPTTLTKEHRWYHIPERRFHLTVRFLASMDLSSYRAEQRVPVAARKLTLKLEQMFMQELDVYERTRAAD